MKNFILLVVVACCVAACDRPYDRQRDAAREAAQGELVTDCEVWVYLDCRKYGGAHARCIERAQTICNVGNAQE